VDRRGNAKPSEDYSVSKLASRDRWDLGEVEARHQRVAGELANPQLPSNPTPRGKTEILLPTGRGIPTRDGYASQPPRQRRRDLRKVRTGFSLVEPTGLWIAFGMPEGSPPPLPNSKKRSSALAWAGLGCAGILLIAFVILIVAVLFFSHKAVQYARKMEENPVRTAAELFIKANPDLELVSADDQAGTMTIRVKETGQTTIVSYADIAQGKFSLTSEDGEFRVETDRTGGGSAKVTVTASDGSVSYLSGPEAAAKVPDWVIAAAYPGAPQPEATFAVEAPGKRSGSLGTTAKDGLPQVTQYYREFLKREGYEVNETSTTADAGMMTFLSARKQAEGKKLVVVCTESPEGTQIFLSFDESGGRQKP
jgi:hypothetical protein